MLAAYVLMTKPLLSKWNHIKEIIFGATLVLQLLACQKDGTVHWNCTVLENHIAGRINGQVYCAEIFELEIIRNTLLINASRDSDKSGTDIEQLTVRIDSFQGEGTYDLLIGDGIGMYREWCCGDILTMVGHTGQGADDSGSATIREFDQSTRKVKGSIEFSATDQAGDKLHFIGAFQGMISE